jgi:probable rRNA maturation factor
VFLGKQKIRTLNNTYRKKDYVTDILSFTLDTSAGEICIYPAKAKSKSRLFDRDYKNYLLYLYIHGMLHLKGFDHETKRDAASMEKEEIRWCKKYKI